MGKIAFLFAGQGAQKSGMGCDLYEKTAAVKAVFDMGERKRPGTLAQCFHGEQQELNQTENTQPCLFLMDLACARALESYGIKADMAAGFSLGEIAALAYTGVLSDKEAFDLVMRRGEKMAECANKYPGAMVAVLRMAEEPLQKLCKEHGVYAVNYNCPGQIVVAGLQDAIGQFAEAVKQAGGRTIPLAVSGAFHTPYMQAASEALELCLKNMQVHTTNISLISNTTAEPYPSAPQEICHTIATQASNSVQWEKTLLYMYEHGVDTFIEVGAGMTLSGLVKKTLGTFEDVKILNVADVESLQNVINAVNGGTV